MFDGSVVVKKQDPDRAPVRSAIVIPDGPDGEFGHAVAVEITQACYGGTEEIILIEVVAKAAFRGANFLVVFDGSVVVKKQDPDRAPVLSAIVIACSPCDEFGHAVAVEISQACQGDAE